MITAETIAEVSRRLVQVYQPREIYLFGSHAWGKPDSDSDLDLLIIVDSLKQDRYLALTAGHRALRGMSIAKDLLLLDIAEFKEYSKDPRRIFYRIKEEGKKIYARA